MKKIILAFSIALVLFIVTVFSVGSAAQKPFNQAKDEAFTLVKKQTDIETMDQFYWYNGEETYFTVIGKNDQNDTHIAIIRQSDGKMTLLEAEGTISEKEAKAITKRDKNPSRILEARIGMNETMPIWEVSFKQDNGQIGYYILSLKTGEWIKSMENI